MKMMIAMYIIHEKGVRDLHSDVYSTNKHVSIIFANTNSLVLPKQRHRFVIFPFNLAVQIG